jgi:hypothetical protein
MLTLVAKHRIPFKKQYGSYVCSCGKAHIAIRVEVEGGRTQSCGCLRASLIGNSKTKHGGCGTAEYAAWKRMRTRCFDPNSARYANYGGRGITVCEEWHDFAVFLSDMGSRPSDKHSLDRINVDGPYCKENCRWATPEQQANNKQDTVHITFEGLTLSCAQWDRFRGWTRGTVWFRIDSGWSAEDAVTRTPKGRS